MSYPHWLNGVSDVGKIMIQRRNEENQSETSKLGYKTSSNSKKDNFSEKLQKEREESKKNSELKLEDINNKINSVLDLISKYIDNPTTELREEIKESFKNFKENMKSEYKRINRAKYYVNIIEKRFYSSAINESWVKISSIKYNKIPDKDMYNGIYEVRNYTYHYLEELKDCNVKEVK